MYTYWAFRGKSWHIQNNLFRTTCISSAVPNPPSGLRLLKSTPVSLRVGWSPGWNGGSPQTFTLTYTNMKSGGQPIHKEIPDLEVGFMQYKLTDGIQPDISYQIEISTQNEYGPATLSITETFKTPREFLILLQNCQF